MTEKEFNYEPLNPKSDYSEKLLTKHYENLNNMMEWSNGLRKDCENPGIWEDVGALLRRNQSYYFNAERSPRSDLETALSEEYNAIGEYAINNSQSIFGKLDLDDYVELVHKVKLSLIGDKGHDEFVEALNKVRSLEEISKDPKQMYTYVQNQIMKSPAWAQQSFVRYGETDVKIIFEQYLMSEKMNLESKMVEGEGENRKVRKSFLKKVFENSLKEAEAEWNKEDYSADEKKKVKDNNVLPYYFVALEHAYNKIKKDEDKPQEKKDRDVRRKERRARGMPF